MSADYKGHLNLASMVSTHIDNWREVLVFKKLLKESLGYDTSYVDHELRALSDIENAVNEELKNV